MIKDTFRIFRYGNSLGMRLPKNLNHSEYATGAVENLILADPTGEVPEKVLKQWLEEVEDKRIDYLKERRVRREQLGLSWRTIK